MVERKSDCDHEFSLIPQNIVLLWGEAVLNRTVSLLAMASCVALLTACGGGGGGSGAPGGGGIITPPPVTPPPPPPPPVGIGANDCAAKPFSLACGGEAAQTLIGATTFIVKNAEGAALSAAQQQAGDHSKIILSSGSQGEAGDEVYNFTFSGHTHYPNLTMEQKAVSGEVLGINTQTYACKNDEKCSDYKLMLLYPETLESGTLDYVLPFISEQVSDNLTKYTVYGVFGRQSDLTQPALQTGGAIYAGTAYGEAKVRGVGDYTTRARLWMEANFATRAIQGTISDFVGYNMDRSEMTLIPLPTKLDFDFKAAFNYADPVFNGIAMGRNDALAIEGWVSGSFFGAPGQVPDEVGLSYFLTTPELQNYIVGVAVGGSSPNALPPPPAPPRLPSPPAVNCIDSSCFGALTRFHGPSTLLKVRNASPGQATPIASAWNNNLDTNVWLEVDPGVLAGVSDDRHRVHYKLNGTDYEQVFGELTPISDALGNYEAAIGADDSLFVKFDLETSLSGSLDFVQLTSYERGSTNTAEMAFIVYGRQSISDEMPRYGGAEFVGSTRGIYIPKEGGLYLTHSDITLSAHFGNGTISGATSNFKLVSTETGNLVSRSEKLDFLYSGSIHVGKSTFSGTAISALPSSAGGLNITGTVEGAFFGGHGLFPDEVGLTYKLGTPITDAFMTGGAVLGKQ